MSKIGKLNDLWGLDISNAGVTDAGLMELREMSTLRSLHVEGSQVTESGRGHSVKHSADLVCSGTDQAQAALTNKMFKMMLVLNMELG